MFLQRAILGDHLLGAIEPFESRSHKLGTTPRMVRQMGSPPFIVAPGAFPSPSDLTSSLGRRSGPQTVDRMNGVPARQPGCQRVVGVVILPEQRSAPFATDPSHFAGKPTSALRPRPPHNPPGRGRDASAPRPQMPQRDTAADPRLLGPERRCRGMQIQSSRLHPRRGEGDVTGVCLLESPRGPPVSGS